MRDKLPKCLFLTPHSYFLIFLLLAALFFAMACSGPDPYYIQVELIEGVPETGEAGTPLTLTGTVRPVFAKNKDIMWSVKDAGTTESNISGNILNANAGGTVTIRARIANGMAAGRDYTQDFKIYITGDDVVEVCTVRFITDGGGYIDDQIITKGQPARRPDDPVKAGHSFIDWYDNGALSGLPYNFILPVTRDITLYARWSTNTFKVTFNSNGGNDIPGQDVIERGIIDKPTDPYKDGYNFGGWYKESALNTKWNFTDDTVTAGITLYARWIAVYTVTFAAHGGNTPAIQKPEDGGKAIRPPNNPERADHDFVDWYSDPGLTAVYDFNTPVTGNITLHAKWVKLISGIDLKVKGPVKGETPNTAAAANGAVSYTVSAASWSPDHDLFQGRTSYTATVTVTAHTDSKFTRTLTAEINGHPAEIINRTDTTVTISHTFDPTGNKAVKKIAVKSQPVKMTYTHGDTLNLAGLSVELTYDDNTTEIVELAGFGDIISANPADSDTLSRTIHNGKPVEVSIGIRHTDTAPLTVSKATPVINFPTAPPITYGMSLSQSAPLTGGSSMPYGTFDWRNGTAIPPVNNSGYPVEFTPDDPADIENFDYSSYGVNWNGVKVTKTTAVAVSKAAGAPVGIPRITGDAATRSITVTPLTLPVSGQSIEYAINTSANAPTDGWQDGMVFGSLALDTTYRIFARSQGNANYHTGTASVSNAAIAFHTVTFDSVDGSDILSWSVISGNTIIAPPDPVKGLYYFGGWYREGSTTPWDFTNDTVTASITLYAKWILNTATITLSMEQITNADPVIDDITVSRTGSGDPATAVVSVNAGLYDPGSIKWEISGVGAYAGSSVTGTGAAFTIDAGNEIYNTLGGHILSLEVEKDGTKYRVNINFYIVD